VIRPHLLILGALALLLLTVPVAAVEEIYYDDVSLVNIDAPQDLTISSIRCADIPAGGSANLNLNAYGQLYLITVEESGSLGWWHFNVTCHYPNGTSASQDLSTLRPFARDYDLTIQPYWITGATDWVLDIDLAVGLVPLTATFQDAYNPTTVQALAFSQASGSFSNPTDVIIYLVTQAEWDAQASNDPTAGLTEGISDLFSWTWIQLLSWVALIPGVGPLFAAAIEITALVISEVFWWFTIAIYHRNLLILLIEFWIIADAMLNTKSLMGMLKKIVNNHIKIARGLIWLTKVSVGLILRVIQAVANAVSALKPI